MKKITIAISVLLLLLALPALSHFGQSPSAAKPVVNVALSTSPVDFIGSVDVSGVPNSPGPASTANSVLSLLPTLPSSPKPAPLAPAFQTKDVSPGSSYINVANSIEGTPGYNPNPCLCAPSDMGLAASNQYVVQMVNLAGTVYSTSGTIVKPTFSLSDFWFAPVRSMSDPQILYDARAGRWFASIIVFVDHVRIAVSATSNPTGIWYIYQVHTPTLNCATSPPINPNPNCLPDQPWIGYSDDKFLIGANDFVFDSTTGIGAPFVGAEYWILNKLELMAGAFAIDAFTNNPSPTDISIRPVPTLSPTTTAYMAENCITVTPGLLVNSCPPSTSQGGIIVFAVTGTPPGPVTVTPTTVPITITGFPASVDQPGHPGTLATNDNRIVSTVWNHNLLWTALNDGNSANGGQCGTVPSCVRLDEISTSGTPSLLQDFDFTANGGAATYFGAVSTDTSNNLVVMYETSSSTVYPSLYVTGQLATAASDTLAPSRLVQAGRASDLTTRWGDYFYAATQPGSSSTFWVSGDYRTIELFQGWQTRIGKITFTTNNPPPPPPPCTESDGNGEFQGQQHGNFAFDNDGCMDGDQNEVSSTDRGDGKDFHSTQLSTVQYDAVAHMITITGVGVSAGRTVSFVFTALETSPTTPGWVSFSFSDGYSSAGLLLNGNVVLH